LPGTREVVPQGAREGSDGMSKKITLIATAILLFLTLAGCVGYVGYSDYDYPYGHSYYYGEPYYGGYPHPGYYHHGGHHDHVFDRDDR
jgi:hypothetical protein